MRPIMKLFSQFEHVANATPFALREEGNISDGIAHGTCADLGVSISCLGIGGKNLSSKTDLRSERNILLPKNGLSWNKQGEITMKSTYGSP